MVSALFPLPCHPPTPLPGSGRNPPCHPGSHPWGDTSPGTPRTASMRGGMSTGPPRPCSWGDMSPRTSSLGCHVPRGPQDPNYELPHPPQPHPWSNTSPSPRTLTMRCHLSLSSMSHPIPHVPDYTVPCPPLTPPYLSDGDSTPKSKLSSVTNRTSGGTLGVSPGCPPTPGDKHGGHPALVLPYLGPRPSPRGTGATCGSWGVTTDPIGVPHPCPYPPPRVPNPPRGPGGTGQRAGDTAGARRRQARCHRHGDTAPPAPVGGGNTGDPRPGNSQPSTPSPSVLSATMGGPSPAP